MAAQMLTERYRERMVAGVTVSELAFRFSYVCRCAAAAAGLGHGRH